MKEFTELGEEERKKSSPAPYHLLYILRNYDCTKICL
jgi:hypothetical protein